MIASPIQNNEHRPLAEAEAREVIADRKLKFALNPRMINKHEGGDHRLYADGFENEELPLEAVIVAVAGEEYGMAICAQMAGSRCAQNFLAADLALVDIDETPSIQAVLEHPLVKNHASFAYTTASHTPEEPRLRVAFVLSRTIDKAKDYAAIVCALTLRLSGDPSATDAARISFGSRGATVFILGEELPEPLMDELIQQGMETAKSQNTKGKQAGSGRSKVAVPNDQDVTLQSGIVLPLSEISPRTTVHCPFHQDRNASAFIVESQQGIRGIFCSTCKQTYWPPGRQEFDFASFDRAAREARAHFDLHRDHGSEGFAPFLNSPETNPGLTDCGISIVTGAPAPPKLLEGIHFIKSPKGSGKTRSLIQLLRDEPSVLLIGHRRSLIRRSCEQLGLECYLDQTERGARHSRFGVCLDSLSKVPTDLRYDVLVLDESEQLLSHFLSETVSRNDGPGPDYLFIVLCHRVQMAKKVVALDADLSWITFTTLTRMNEATRR